MKRAITSYERLDFRIFGRDCCSLTLVLECGHEEIRKLSALPNYRTGLKIKCRACTRSAPSTKPSQPCQP